MTTESDAGGDLQSYIAALRSGPGRIRFADAIHAISGCDVVPLDPSLAEDKALLEAIATAANQAMRSAYHDGVYRARPNEVGNDMEAYLKTALIDCGLQAGTPTTQAGIRAAMGYPDIEVIQRAHRYTYLEVKTYSADTEGSGQRTFYMSPPASQETCKVAHEARHLAVSFRIERQERDGRTAFVPVAWAVWDLHDMAVGIKYEFNASNPEIYRDEALLARGSMQADHQGS